MSQSNIVVPSGTGLAVRTAINSALKTLASSFAGPTDPAIGGNSVEYMWWIDTTNMLVKQRSATNDSWVEKGYLDSDGTIMWYPNSGVVNGSLEVTGTLQVDGALYQPNPVSITSSSGVVTLTEASNSFVVSGTEAVTSITGWTKGVVRIRWANARTITYNATSLILQNGADRTVAVGDISEFEMTTAGAREVDYFPATAAAKSDVSFPLGTGNYTVSGRKVSGVSGLQATLAAGKHVINDTPVSFAANTVTLPTRSTSLIYDKADGTTGQVQAAIPLSYIDNNTVAFWDFTDWDGSSAIANKAVGYNGNTLAVANALTKTGTVTRVDGWAGYGAQGDGNTGYFASANSTNFPGGANARELSVLFTPTLQDAVIRSIVSYGSGTSGVFFQVYVLSGRLRFDIWGTGYDTGFDLTMNTTYLITVAYSGTTLFIYVNGTLVYSLTIKLNTTIAIMRVFWNTAASQYSAGVVHFVELRNAMRTAQQIAQIANKLLLPNFYTDTDGTTRKNIIDDVLPENSNAVAFVRTSSSAITTYNDTDYQYGRREKAFGGNRRVFLGWKSITPNAQVMWANPFGTGIVRVSRILYKKSLTDYQTSHVDMFYPNAFRGGTVKSINPFYILLAAANDKVISVLSSYTNADETTGYYAVEIEVLE